jgi:DNA-binding protein H-NS
MEMTMRKPRDYDAELKALEDKAKELKARKVQQLGELVIATGADAFTPEELAGALIVLAETKDAARREAWGKRGAAFFRSRSRRSPPTADRDPGSTIDRNAGRTQTQPGGTQPAPGSAGTA